MPTLWKASDSRLLTASAFVQDLRHIDHPRFYTWAAPCCFKAPVRREGQRIVTRFQLQDDMENELCSEDPWLVLHKIDSPTKMRYIGNRVQVAALCCLFQRRRRLRRAGLCWVDKSHLSHGSGDYRCVCIHCAGLQLFRF